jgi:hypothetical protein
LTPDPRSSPNAGQGPDPLGNLSQADLWEALQRIRTALSNEVREHSLAWVCAEAHQVSARREAWARLTEARDARERVDVRINLVFRGARK